MCENELRIVQAIYTCICRCRSRGLGGMGALVSLPILFLGEHTSRPRLWIHLRCILRTCSIISDQEDDDEGECNRTIDESGAVHVSTHL